MPKYDTEYTDFPTCPHCGETNQDWWDGLPPKNDGDEWEQDCDCGETYIAQLNVSYNFKTWKKK
jgi:hypothetical protein